MKFIIAFFLCAASTGALAEQPKACADQEPYEVCALKIQRNNALDELAISDAARRRLQDLVERNAEYWKQYLSGEEAQRSKLKARGK